MRYRFAMPRRPETPGKPATEPVKVLMSPEMLAFVDVSRRELSRAAWLRSLVRDEARRRSAPKGSGLPRGAERGTVEDR